AAAAPTPLPPRAHGGGPHPASGWRSGARVRHPKFGVGTVLRIEGEGDLTKLTVSFPGHGLKKLLEKAAMLSRV
ncbi:MAG: hypothetical protein ACRD1A_11450, partial [Terriglobales bacterium]